MFDLFRRRDKAVRYLLTALLAMVALSMVTYLIPGSGMSTGGEDQVVAEIGGEPLTAQEVRTNVQNALKSKSLPPDMVGQLLPQYINEMITERALALEAKRLGFEVTDNELTQMIQSLLGAQLFPDGKFMGKDAYAAFLGQQGMTIPEFETNLRKQLLMSKLTKIGLEGIVVTPSDVEAEYKAEHDKIKLEYIAITQDKLRTQVAVTPQELQTFFDQNKAQYRVGEKRSFDMIVVDQAKIAESIKLPDSELQRAYDVNKERYRTPERARVRHILLKTMDKPKDEVPKIQAKAEALLKQLKAGADFAELAKKNSEDPGSAVKGGDLDWVVRGQMVPEFEAASFSLKPKEISNLVKTQYGFHIVQVLEKQDAQVKPFESVKNEIADELRKAQVYNRVQNLADQARALLAKNPQQAQQVADQLKLPLVKVENAGAGDPIPEIGANPELDGAIAGLPKNGVTPVITANNSKLVVAVITAVVPARDATLPEVQAKVREAFINNKVGAMAQAKAKEVLDQLKANGGDLQKVAKAMGFEVKTTSEFDQKGAAEGIGPAAMVLEAFSKPVGGIVGPVPANEKAIICRVAARTPADMSQLPAERNVIVERLKGKNASERKDLFEDGVVAQLIKDGKIKKHDDAIARLVRAYSSS